MGEVFEDHVQRVRCAALGRRRPLLHRSGGEVCEDRRAGHGQHLRRGGPGGGGGGAHRTLHLLPGEQV